MVRRSFNILGSIALVNFSEGTKVSEKKKFASEILKKNKVVKTVLEKSGNFSGRLRKMKTKHLAGEKNKEVLYQENGCVFRFNIDTTYFSPRLSNERKEISKLIKKNEEVLVMFAGVAPFSIVIAKNSKAKKVYSNEINREANKYAKLNLELNKVKDKVELVPGDVKRIAGRTTRVYQGGARTSSRPRKTFSKSFYKGQNLSGKKFDVIVMPRPNLKDTFLEQAFELSKKGTRIYYYGFCKVEDKEKIVDEIKEEAKKAKKKIKILRKHDAGEIAPYKVRFRVDFKIV
jgi:tRNA (guanine37-N1)-methyltransferase